MKDTKELREKKVKEALAINSLDAKEPTEECMKLLEDYVEGRSTIEENKAKIIEKYTK
ncbi:hypothetical protein [Clostridium sp.]|uniref:antitoxin VbhA family protein n=1 Tax=Clostridium sp. TaxID=1506 RepID=UPI003F3F55B7